MSERMKYWLVYDEIVESDCLLAACAAPTQNQALDCTSDALHICVDDLVAISSQSEQNAHQIARERRVPYLTISAQKQEEAEKPPMNMNQRQALRACELLTDCFIDRNTDESFELEIEGFFQGIGIEPRLVGKPGNACFQLSKRQLAQIGVMAPFSRVSWFTEDERH